MKFFSKATALVSVLILLVQIAFPLTATAATITSAKATFGRLKASTAADYITVEFATPTGIQTGGGDTITLTFSSDFTLASEDAANFDVELGDDSDCSTANFTDEVVALSASSTDWGVDVTGQVMTFSPETDQTLTAGNCMRIVMGSAATTGGTGSSSTVTNGAADDDDTITVGGAFGDTGTITVDIVDDDQVSVTASVNQALTFDLDTATSGSSETNAPYSVALGSITTTDTRVSGTTDNVNMVTVEADSNAPGGLVVTVHNDNGSNGLVSTSVPADNIGSADGTMADGTENYGLCVATSGLTGFSRAGGYSSGSCALDTETNAIQGLSATPEDILSASGSVTGAHAEVVVNAAIATTTASHSDYTDKLTFIATGTF